MSLWFEHPFTCVVAGPTKSGKTCFIKKLLSALPLYVYPCPDRIVWCHGIGNNSQMENIQSSSKIKIEFMEGIPDLSIFSAEEKNLLILDDLMKSAGKSSKVADIFTKGCHHQNISVILIVQNYFHQGSQMRDIHTNTNYLVLFNNPKERAFIKSIERQCFPGQPNFLVKAYKEAACSRPFGYLILDFTQLISDEFRVGTGIFPPEVIKVWGPI